PPALLSSDQPSEPPVLPDSGQPSEPPVLPDSGQPSEPPVLQGSDLPSVPPEFLCSSPLSELPDILGSERSSELPVQPGLLGLDQPLESTVLYSLLHGAMNIEPNAQVSHLQLCCVSSIGADHPSLLLRPASSVW
ncbi:hypothetical protein LDENG_00217080, partial [Lucifuga dentata]